MVGLGSWPGSVTVYVYAFVSPSLAELGPERTTTGGRLATATVIESEPTLLEASPSSAVTLTIELAGPSGNVHWK